MSLTTVFFLVLMAVATLGVKPHGPSCEEFSKGASFTDSQAVGTWHLLQYRTEKSQGAPGESQCVSFASLGDKEQKDLSDRIGKYVKDVKWERMVFKMQIPCSASPSNRTRDYYLEKLDGSDGSYRTLQMPAPGVNLESANFHRYPMRLKMVEGQYLGMMDCSEHFVFLLGKQPATKEADEKLKKLVEAYWPKEH